MTAGGISEVRVLVDASAAYDQPAGIGRYARNVLTAAVGADPGFAWTLARFPERFGPPPFPFDRDAPWPGVAVRRRTLPLTRRRADQLFFRLRAPIDLRWLAGGADVAYSPDFTMPPAGKVPAAVTVHDLAFLTHPQFAPAGLRGYLSAVVPRVIERCARVVAVSDATKQTLIDHLKLEPAKIALVGNGVDARFFSPPRLTDEQRAALGLPGRFLLMVGTLEPRKNHLNAFAALDHLAVPERLPLVVAGRRGWEVEPILAEAHRRAASGQVLLLDYVPEAYLPSLYASAAAVLYPSWTEGFGLPVLEAMAAGTPVVTSTAPALREVGGETVWYADPADPASIAAAITATLDQAGSDRVERARQRAAEFTWARSGRALATLLRTMA